MTSAARLRLFGLVAASLLAFAGNSILCRAALSDGRTDPATFTLLRLVAGAIALHALARAGSVRPASDPRGSFARAGALFAYAALFSWAYVRVGAGVGALVLFGCVQLTMIGWAVVAGSSPRGTQWLGIALAFGGLAVLTLPGAEAPDPLGLLLMAGSGVAWGTYSLLGRGGGSPLATTARAFVGAAPLALVVALVAAATGGLRVHAEGIASAVVSGGVTSGLGYAIWYSALPSLDATRAAVVQLAVPVLAAIAGIVLLGETWNVRVVASSAAVLGGIAWAFWNRSPRPRV